MKSLKQIITEERLKPSKLKEFGIYLPDIEQYIDVPSIPNCSIFKGNMPKLIARNSKTYTYVVQKELEEESDMLSSSSMQSEILGSNDNNIIFSDDGVANSTYETTQHILTSSDPILQSDTIYDFI